MPLASYSYIIRTSDQANDLVAEVELPFDPEQLDAIGVNPSNTYVGTLAQDKKNPGWSLRPSGTCTCELRLQAVPQVRH